MKGSGKDWIAFARQSFIVSRLRQREKLVTDPAEFLRHCPRTDPYLLRCLLMAFVIWNISNRAFPKLASAFHRLQFLAASLGLAAYAF